MPKDISNLYSTLTAAIGYEVHVMDVPNDRIRLDRQETYTVPAGSQVFVRDRATWHELYFANESEVRGPLVMTKPRAGTGKLTPWKDQSMFDGPTLFGVLGCIIGGALVVYFGYRDSIAEFIVSGGVAGYIYGVVMRTLFRRRRTKLNIAGFTERFTAVFEARNAGEALEKSRDDFIEVC